MYVVGTPCRLCGKPTDDQRPIIVTWGVPFPDTHPLWEFCEAPLHQECLTNWPERRRFARGYFDVAVASHGPGRVGFLAQGAGWLLAVGPAGARITPSYAAIDLSDWPIRLHARWDDWTKEIEGGFLSEFTGQSRAEVERVLNEVKTLAATTEQLRQLWEAAGTGSR